MVVTKNTSQKGPLSGWDKWPEWVGQSGDWVGFVPSSYNLKIGTAIDVIYLMEAICVGYSQPPTIQYKMKQV